MLCGWLSYRPRAIYESSSRLIPRHVCNCITSLGTAQLDTSYKATYVFFLFQFLYSFTRFVHKGLSLFSDFPFLIMLFLLLSLCMCPFSVTIFLLSFFLYLVMLPLRFFVFSLPVCPQLPNIFQFLLYFLYIYI